jgi:putative salt-induced outer membrane protein YdiY
MHTQRIRVVTAVSVGLFLMVSCLAQAEDVVSPAVPAATPPAAPVNPDVVKDWNGNVALGLSVANGNSSAYSASAGAALDKQWKKDEWHFGANGQYAVTNPERDDQDVTANNIHGAVNYRHLFDERLYGAAGEEIVHDDVADITYRFVTSVGPGYYFIKEPATRLRGEAGPSWLYERVSGSDPAHHNYIAARVAERFEHDFSKNAKVWQSLEYLAKVDDWGNYLLNAEIGAESVITGSISLRLVARDQYNSQPPAGSKSNDITVVGALVYKFGQK